MTYSWASRDRLCPMRMVWLDYNYGEPIYEIKKLVRPFLRAETRVDRMSTSRIEFHSWRGARMAGRLGDWPLWRPDHRKRAKPAARTKKRRRR